MARALCHYRDDAHGRRQTVAQDVGRVDGADRTGGGVPQLAVAGAQQRRHRAQLRCVALHAVAGVEAFKCQQRPRIVRPCVEAGGGDAVQAFRTVQPQVAVRHAHDAGDAAKALATLARQYDEAAIAIQRHAVLGTYPHALAVRL